MERVMSRWQHYTHKNDEEFYLIGGNEVHGGHNISVRVPEGSRPGRPDFPGCVDCGSQDMSGDAEYTAEGFFDWWPLVCNACGSAFVVREP